ncbi:MAG TPA: hypothetical protein VMV69_10315 [Pirellulales bacterium]|nr:hypothetical protein [Pirellulales bacterium]
MPTAASQTTHPSKQSPVATVSQKDFLELKTRVDGLQTRLSQPPPTWYHKLQAGDWTSAAEAFVAFLSMIVAIIFSFLAGRHSSRANVLAEQANTHASHANDYAIDANQAAVRANALTEEMLRITIGQSEISLRAAIQQVLRDVTEVCKEIEEYVAGRPPSAFNATQKRELEAKQARLKTAVEAEFTVYDFACRQYFDRKLDQPAFKQDCCQEIKRLCEEKNEIYRDLAQHPTISRFKSLWQAYNQFYGPDTSVG